MEQKLSYPVNTNDPLICTKGYNDYKVLEESIQQLFKICEGEIIRVKSSTIYTVTFAKDNFNITLGKYLFRPLTTKERILFFLRLLK